MCSVQSFAFMYFPLMHTMGITWRCLSAHGAETNLTLPFTVKARPLSKQVNIIFFNKLRNELEIAVGYMWVKYHKFTSRQVE